jgi:hypothetical protein
MRFLSLVKSVDNQGPPPQALMDAMDKLMAESIADGSLVSTGGLGSSKAMYRIRSAGGKLTPMDGPFTEAKEIVGGFAMLEAPTREAAIESTRKFMEIHAKHWPAWEGECELREIVYQAP